MKSPMVSALTLALLTLLTEHVCSHGIIASKNPLPVGSNVTLSLCNDHTFTVTSWSHGGDKLIFLYPGGQSVHPQWKNRITYNRTGGRLTIRSLQVADSGDYIVHSIQGSFAITLSVQEPVTAVKLTANITEMSEFSGSVSLSCSSSGSSLSYLWLNGSSEVTASEGVQLGDGNITLTIVNVTRYDQGPFRCNVSNAISDAVSQPQNLIINCKDDVACVLQGSHSTGEGSLPGSGPLSPGAIAGIAIAGISIACLLLVGVLGYLMYKNGKIQSYNVTNAGAGHDNRAGPGNQELNYAEISSFQKRDGGTVQLANLGTSPTEYALV